MDAYLDHNATTRPLPEVVAAVRGALEDRWANPSSVHKPGQAAGRTVELARASVARLLGVKPRTVVFTGSGTESIDLAIRGTLAATGKRTLITTRVEHAAVRDLAGELARHGDVEVLWAPLDAHGRVDPAALAGMLGGSVGLVSVQWANNETGAVQPVREIAEACRSARVPFHCDATQWVGKMPVDLGAPDAPAIDLLTCSPHKFHGPKGVGVLWVSPPALLRPVIHGSQELGRRGGTEPVPAIAGAGAAAEAAIAWLERANERGRLAALRDRLESGVLARSPGAVVNGPTGASARLWNTTNIGFPGVAGEAMLMVLSDLGVAASAGAACSSGSLDPSPVLLAMGVPEPIAHGSIRFSLGRFTTEAEIGHAVDAIGRAAGRVRGSAPR